MRRHDDDDDYNFFLNQYDPILILFFLVVAFGCLWIKKYVDDSQTIVQVHLLTASLNDWLAVDPLLTKLETRVAIEQIKASIPHQRFFRDDVDIDPKVRGRLKTVCLAVSVWCWRIYFNASYRDVMTDELKIKVTHPDALKLAFAMVMGYFTMPTYEDFTELHPAALELHKKIEAVQQAALEHQEKLKLDVTHQKPNSN